MISLSSDLPAVSGPGPIHCRSVVFGLRRTGSERTNGQGLSMQAGTSGQGRPVLVARVSTMALGAALVCCGAAGCSHSLFKRGVSRSQYETYDTVRNRHEADSYEDEFGRRRINLRGRLLQSE